MAPERCRGFANNAKRKTTHGPNYDRHLTMKQSTTSSEAELATGWPLGKVEASLNETQKDPLVTLIRQRYEERFLEPIRTLRSAKGHARGYGFAIMALCSLLIESLQSYRYGLPTTYDREYGALASFTPPSEHEIPVAERKLAPRYLWTFLCSPLTKLSFPT
jgi:hypothetical protein